MRTHERRRKKDARITRRPTNQKSHEAPNGTTDFYVAKVGR